MATAFRLLVASLAASVALAAPTSSSATDRLSRRISPRSPLNTAGFDVERQTNSSWRDVYATHVSGASLNSSEETYRSVTGQFVLPDVASDALEIESFDIWVGIDGRSCESAFLQTGITVTVSGSGVSYTGWYEWYPDYAYDYPNLELHLGDVVQITVTSTTRTTGIATISNLTRRRTATKYLTSAIPLCQRDVEWAVETISSSSKVPHFGPIVISEAAAVTATMLKLSGAEANDEEWLAVPGSEVVGPASGTIHETSTIQVSILSTSVVITHVT